MGVSADAVLRQGAVAWLHWRAEYLEVPDLSDAQLRWLNLRSAMPS